MKKLICILFLIIGILSFADVNLVLGVPNTTIHSLDGKFNNDNDIIGVELEKDSYVIQFMKMENSFERPGYVLTAGKYFYVNKVFEISAVAGIAKGYNVIEEYEGRIWEVYMIGGNLTPMGFLGLHYKVNDFIKFNVNTCYVFTTCSISMKIR